MHFFRWFCQKYTSPIKKPQTKKANDHPGYSEQKKTNLFI